MGNRNANDNQNNNININGGVHEHILVNNNDNNIQEKFDFPSVKKAYAVRNPFLIHKTSITLEKDAGPLNIYYIKFKYDSLVNFNCYINFCVSKNHSKPLVPKTLPTSDNYILSYLPSINFEKHSIAIKNLQKGENMEFFEKKAIIDIDHFKINREQTTKNNEKMYDMSIELVPVYEGDEKDGNNEIVFLSLCTLEQEEIGRHPHSLKIDCQKLKTFGMWIDVYDIYNSSLDNGECLICCSTLRNTIFLPCKHACTCNTCAHSLKLRNNPCPICKNPIRDLLVLEVDEVNKIIVNNNFEDQNYIKDENVMDVNDNINNENNNINNTNGEYNTENLDEEEKKMNE